MDAISVFVKVVEAGSFSAAARRLGMPKTTVSAKVAGLERRLGVRLIQRTTRKLRMTEAGEKYFRHCAIAIREVELGEAALQSTKGRPYGVLKVTAPVAMGQHSLPRIARAYAAKYPDVSLELILTNRVVDLVEEGVDLAIRWAGELRDSSLIARRFFEARSSSVGVAEIHAGVWQARPSARPGPCGVRAPSSAEVSTTHEREVGLRASDERTCSRR